MVPIIQTMTRAFKFEKNYGDKYSDGSENDKLRKIAKIYKIYLMQNHMQSEQMKNINEMEIYINISMPPKMN